MKVPLSQLKLFIDLSSLDSKSIAEKLTLLGMEVDSLQVIPPFQGVVVAQVESISSHPNSKNLQVARVKDSSQSYSLVSKHFKLPVGQKVALAKVGATLFDEERTPFSVEKRMLSGVVSEGHLPTEKDLGISSSENVYLLDASFPLGQDLYPLVEDTIFDISLTPNLGHCLSVLGVARELAASLSLSWSLPPIKRRKLAQDPDISLSVDPEVCSQFFLRKLERAHVQPSPLWLQRILQKFDLPSLNNVVDITNYLLMLYGQPLHIYDFASISSSSILVDKQKNQSFQGLDQVPYQVEEGVFVRTSNQLLSLAGILGGESSKVKESSTTLLLESAHFSFLPIRKTQKQLKFRSESGQRFEKGVDSQMVEIALEHACSLLEEIAGAKVVSQKAFEGKPAKKEPLSLRLPYLHKLLGVSLSLSEVQEILKRLGFSCHTTSKEKLQVEVPSYRNDIHLEVDLIEEVARIYGFNHLRSSSPSFRVQSLGHHPLYLLERQVREHLIGQGLQELITTDLISPELAKVSTEATLSEKDLLSVIHAKSEEYSILRASLLGSHLQVLKHNLSHKQNALQGFEISPIHFKQEGGYEEQKVVSLIFSGTTFPFHFSEKPKLVSFLDIKGILENFFEALGISGYTFKPSSHPSFHPGRQADILVEDRKVGVIGQVHVDTLALLDLSQETYFVEIHLLALLQKQKKDHTFTPLPSFPGSERDWTLSLPAKLPLATFFQLTTALKSPLLEKVVLLDIYEDPKVGKEKKKVTFRFYYRDLHKTLSFEEAEKEHQTLKEKIQKSLEAYISS